jgi:hypothetical protein
MKAYSLDEFRNEQSELNRYIERCDSFLLVHPQCIIHTHTHTHTQRLPFQIYITEYDNKTKYGLHKQGRNFIFILDVLYIDMSNVARHAFNRSHVHSKVGNRSFCWTAVSTSHLTRTCLTLHNIQLFGYRIFNYCVTTLVTFAGRQRKQVLHPVINRNVCHFQIHTASAVWSIICI